MDKEVKNTDELKALEKDMEPVPESEAKQSPMGISATSSVPDPDPIIDHSKEYLEAPFSYIYSDHESVALNSGALTYTVTDFILPGKNGLDFAVTRRYNSLQSNVNDIEYRVNNVLGTRPNNHETSIYGIGQGWSFCFSSIESIREQNGTFSNFLHLADGRSYRIDTSSASGLKDYPLVDIRLAKVSGSSPVPHDYVLSHKDGTKEYLKISGAAPSQKSKLVAVQDRFGNLIQYTFNDNGGATVIDTLGRAVRLVKSGSILTWTLPDNKKIEYTVSNDLLTQTKDQAGRETRFEYDSVGVSSSPLPGKSISLTHRPLKTITFPSGAQSRYTYVTLTHRSEHGTLTSLVVSSRKDVVSGNPFNEKSFSYTSAYNTSKKHGYVNQATATKDGGVVETHLFNGDSLCCSFAHFFIPILADYLRPCLFNILFISQKAAPQGLLLIAN